MERKRLLLIITIFTAVIFAAGVFGPVRAFEDTQETEAMPGTPVPEYPRDSETGNQVGFYWTPAENAASYEVKWKSETGSEGLIELDSSDPTCQAGRCIAFDEIPAQGTCTWTVTAVNEAGSADSEEVSFVIRASLPAPDAYRPNVALNSQKPLTFEWQDIRSNATDFRIQIMDRATDSIFRDEWFKVSDMWVGNGECYMETGIYLPSGSYAWRVKAKSASSESDWSAWVDFQTNCVDCALGSYLNTTTSAICPQGVTTDPYPVFKWLAVTGAAYYAVRVDDEAGNTFVDAQVPSSNCTLETCTFDPGMLLKEGGTYTWSVTTYGGNNGRWGTDAGTIILAETAEVKDIAFVEPENGGKLDAENPLIIWTDPGSSAAAFTLLITDAGGAPVFYGNLNREDAWCDGKTCSVLFRTIPDGDNFVIYITPYSESNVPGVAISLTFIK